MSTSNGVHRSALILLCGALVAGAVPAAAQQYPDRPVRMILPQGPGSTTDLLGRIAFAASTKSLTDFAEKLLLTQIAVVARTKCPTGTKSRSGS